MVFQVVDQIKHKSWIFGICIQFLPFIIPYPQAVKKQSTAWVCHSALLFNFFFIHGLQGVKVFAVATKFCGPVNMLKGCNSEYRGTSFKLEIHRPIGQPCEIQQGQMQSPPPGKKELFIGKEKTIWSTALLKRIRDPSGQWSQCCVSAVFCGSKDHQHQHKLHKQEHGFVGLGRW